MDTYDKRPPGVVIFESDSTASQSMNAAMIAEQDLGLVTYLAPVDLRDEEVEVRSAIKLIWPDLDLEDEAAVAEKLAKLPEQDKPIEQRGQYYLIVVETKDGEGLHIFVPEGHVVPMMFMAAAMTSKEAARRLLYRFGLLPTV